jgi:Spy/CpxP family protein refolding chaperone
MEILKMLTKTKAVLAAALILGAGSLAQAANENDGGNETGGFVHPPSMDGVNPVHHPRWFGPGARQGNAGEAYGYDASPKKTHRVTHEHTQDR